MTTNSLVPISINEASLTCALSGGEHVTGTENQWTSIAPARVVPVPDGVVAIEWLSTSSQVPAALSRNPLDPAP